MVSEEAVWDAEGQGGSCAGPLKVGRGGEYGTPSIRYGPCQMRLQIRYDLQTTYDVGYDRFIQPFTSRLAARFRCRGVIIWIRREEGRRTAGQGVSRRQEAREIEEVCGDNSPPNTRYTPLIAFGSCVVSCVYGSVHSE